MAVTALNVELSWSKEARGENMAVMGFTVELSEPGGTLEQAMTANASPAGAIPQKGDAYPANTLLWARTPTARWITPTLAEVIVNFEGARGQSDPNTTPKLPPDTVYWDSDVSQEAVDYDANDNPFVNSAGEPFEPPPTKECRDPVVVITHYIWETDFDPGEKTSFENTTNNAAVTVDGFEIPTYGGRITAFTVEQVQDPKGNAQYRKQTIRISIRLDNVMWDLHIADDGTYYLTGDGEKKNFEDKDGSRLARPGHLDGSGSPSSSTTFNNWTIYPAADWSGMSYFSS